eukprot:1130720-Ditylum_brightwellii.AAC.1
MLSCLNKDNGSKPSSTDNDMLANNIKDLKNKELNSFSEKPDDVMIAVCYVDKGDNAVPPHSFPLKFKLIQKEQQKDKIFLETLKK